MATAEETESEPSYPGILERSLGMDRPLYDLGLFAATVAAAAAQGWSTTDLVWSLWISSLLVGYAFILVTLLLGNDAPEEGHPVLRVLGRVAGCLGTLVTLGFVTFHFGAFHFVHSAFLNEFFPLAPESIGPVTGLDPLWWGAVIKTAVERYWPFLLVTVLSRRSDFVRSFRTRPEGNEMLGRPYLNVVRMHLLIFAYFGLEEAGLSGWFLYVVLFFYFFPLGAVKELVQRHLLGAEA